MADFISYPAALAFHLLAVAFFLGGLLALALALPSLSKGRLDPARQAMARRCWVGNILITTPALCLVWAFGLTLVAEGGWFSATWLRVKVILVVVLTAHHVVQTARLRHLHRGTRLTHPQSYGPALLVGILVASIIGLVTVKPW